jgi:hypothetical protein
MEYDLLLFWNTHLLPCILAEQACDEDGGRGNVERIEGTWKDSNKIERNRWRERKEIYRDISLHYGRSVV